MEDLIEAKRSLKTPGTKLKGGLFLAEMMSSSPILENVESVPDFEEDMEAVSFKVMQSRWNNLVANVELLLHEISTQQDGERELWADLGKNFLGLQGADINSGKVKLWLLMAHIGGPLDENNSSLVW
eukprot:scaffold47535_cov62-Attheya_sp.AAC.1